MKNPRILIACALAFVSANVSADVCLYAENTLAKASTGIAALGLAAGTTMQLVGVSVVAHSSGALILSSSSGYMAGTLGVAGAVGGFISAPVTLIVGGVAIISTGSAAAYCHYNKASEKPLWITPTLTKRHN